MPPKAAAKYNFAYELVDGCLKMPLQASIFTYGIIKDSQMEAKQDLIVLKKNMLS